MIYHLIDIVLCALLWFKIIYHVKYYNLLSIGSSEKDMADFFYELIKDDEPFYNSLGNFLKFILPIFWKEILDIGEPEYSIYRSRIHTLLKVWWFLALVRLSLTLNWQEVVKAFG